MPFLEFLTSLGTLWNIYLFMALTNNAPKPLCAADGDGGDLVVVVTMMIFYNIHFSFSRTITRIEWYDGAVPLDKLLINTYVKSK